MVVYVKDKTGRFGDRPHYQPGELDRECEKIIVDYLKLKHGSVAFPVGTEDLKTLIEASVDDLDCYADLSHYGEDVEGITEFHPNKKPIVRISKKLTEDERYENRLRTTLTHEFGHVRFHAYLFAMNLDQSDLFAKSEPQTHVSKRDNIMNAPTTDWMEWQAGCVCGAILMPISYVQKIAGDFLQKHNQYGTFSPTSEKGLELTRLIIDAFQVSQDAARVRLIKLEILGAESGPSLFS